MTTNKNHQWSKQHCSTRPSSRWKLSLKEKIVLCKYLRTTFLGWNIWQNSTCHFFLTFLGLAAKKDRKTQWSIDTFRWSVVCTMWLQVRVVLKWRGWYWCRSIIQEDWLIALPLYMVTLASFYIKAISNEVHSTNKRAFKVKHCIELFFDQVHTSSTISSSNTLIVCNHTCPQHFVNLLQLFGRWTGRCSIVRLILASWQMPQWNY